MFHFNTVHNFYSIKIKKWKKNSNSDIWTTYKPSYEYGFCYCLQFFSLLVSMSQKWCTVSESAGWLAKHMGSHGLNLDRVKPMTYTIDTCHYITWQWHSALIRNDNDWLTQYKDNVIECNINIRIMWLSVIST